MLMFLHILFSQILFLSYNGIHNYTHWHIITTFIMSVAECLPPYYSDCDLDAENRTAICYVMWESNIRVHCRVYAANSSNFSKQIKA